VGSIIVRFKNQYWLLNRNLQNAWNKRLPFTFVPERAKRISLSQRLYEWLGIPLDEDQEP
jgi:hypothetical protein